MVLGLKPSRFTQDVTSGTKNPGEHSVVLIEDDSLVSAGEFGPIAGFDRHGAVEDPPVVANWRDSDLICRHIQLAQLDVIGCQGQNKRVR